MEALDTLRSQVAALRNEVRVRGVGVDSPQFRAWLNGETVANPGFAISTLDAWNQDPVLRKAIDVLCRSAGWLPFQVGRRSDVQRNRKPMSNHWLPALLARPNPFYSTFQLWAFTVAHLSLFGECFWWLYQRGAENRPVELWIIDPRAMVPNVNTRSLWPIMSWDIMIGGQRMATVLPQDIAHFRYPNPHSLWRGSPPLEAAAISVAGDIEMSRYNFAFFKRGAKIAGVLQTEGDRSIKNEEQADVVRASFMRRYNVPHSIAVLWGGLRFHETTQSHRDSEFMEGKKLVREEILMTYGVPPVLMGLSDGQTYANAHEQQRTFWLITMLPLLQLIADQIAQTFLLREPDNMCWFDVTGVEALREQFDTKSQTFQRFVGYGMPYNDAIDLLQIPVKRQKWGDTSLVPYTWTPADTLIENANASDTTQPTSDTTSTTEKPAVGDQTNAVEAAVVKARTALVDVKRILESPRAPRQIAGQTRDAIDELIASIVLTIEDDRDKLSSFARFYYDRFFQMGGEQMGEMLGIEFDVEQYPEALRFLEEKEIKIRAANDTVRDNIRDQLREGLAAGEGADALADRVRDVYNFETNYGAGRIARTEAAQVVNTARNMVMRDEGVEEREWVSAHDERVRESHAEEDGNTVSGDDTYPVTGLAYPGDPDGAAEEIINCRCLELPVINSDDEKAIVPVSRYLTHGSAEEREAKRSLRDHLWRTITAQYGRDEKSFKRKLRKFFTEQRKRVLPLVYKLKQ